MKDILFFTNNLNKISEIKNLMKEYKINIFSPKDYELKEEPKENGASFAENAKIKSEFGYRFTRLPCFADDSGICIEALDGKPGINSKRFLNNFKNKKDCFDFIINETSRKKNNRAYFKTSICLTNEKGYNVFFEGRVDGIISKLISGSKGFGYDPIFIPNGLSKTFGQMKLKEKNLLSHRSIAIQKFLQFIIN